MFKKTALKITTSKLASTSASLLPGTLILISGIVVWRLWYKQAQLQTKTNKISNEVKYLKKYIAKTIVTNEAEKEKKEEKSIKEEKESITALSSSLQKMARFNPWSTDK